MPEVSADVLRGVAASAGIATGAARVILRADTDEQVRAREILVAPFTDPGWTPYFVPAATRIIRTGQKLRVDGNRGVVTILA